MLFAIVKRWWRWHVYELGHTDGDGTWLATFRHRRHAEAFVRSFGKLPVDPGDPCNDMSAVL